MLSFLILFLASAAQGSDAITSAPPILEGKAPACICEDSKPGPTHQLTGIVLDTELTLAADGLSVNDRRATVFDVAPVTIAGKQLFGRTRVWHGGSPQSCGVSFEYGKRYDIPVRKTEKGRLETDQCLINKLGDGAAADGTVNPKSP